MVSQRDFIISRCVDTGIVAKSKESLKSLKRKLSDGGVDIDRELSEHAQRSKGAKSGLGTQAKRHVSTRDATTSGEAVEPSDREDGAASILQPDAAASASNVSAIVDAVLVALDQRASKGVAEVPKKPTSEAGRRRSSATSASEISEDSDFSDVEEVPRRPSTTTRDVGDGKQTKSPMALRYSVPDSVRKLVLDNRHVPLYKLLQGFDSSGSHLTPTTDEDGSVRFTMGEHPKEKKLSRQPLDISLLVLGLLKYKDIIIDLFPERAKNVDMYIANIIGVHTKYPGLSYWYYHSLFWDRAFMDSDKRNGASLDWSVLDPEALHSAIAACGGPHFCDRCQDWSHATTKCPFYFSEVADPEVSTSAERGRAATYYKGKKICDRFNFGLCKNTGCTFVHVCCFCNSFDHPVSRCKQAPRHLRDGK